MSDDGIPVPHPLQVGAWQVFPRSDVPYADELERVERDPTTMVRTPIVDLHRKLCAAGIHFVPSLLNRNREYYESMQEALAAHEAICASKVPPDTAHDDVLLLQTMQRVMDALRVLPLDRQLRVVRAAGILLGVS